MNDPWKPVFRRLAKTQSALIASIRTSQYGGDLPSVAIAFKLAMDAEHLPHGDALASALSISLDEQFFDEFLVAFVEAARAAIARHQAVI